MPGLTIESELKGSPAPNAGSQWQAAAESKWRATAVWIHGDGQFAVLQPCSDQLTVTLCASLVDATRVKKETCCGRCFKSRHLITDLGGTSTP